VRYPLRSRFLSYDDMTFIAGLNGLAGRCAAAEKPLGGLAQGAAPTSNGWISRQPSQP